MHVSTTRRRFLVGATAAAAALLLPLQSKLARAMQLQPGRNWQLPTPWAPRQSDRPMPNVDTWLASHPNVRDAIVWERSDGVRVPYSAWGRSQGELAQAYADAYHGVPTGLPKVPTNIGKPGTTVLSASEAWHFYLAHVAHSLAVELRGDLPWSLTNMPWLELAVLFDSSQYFDWNQAAGGYQLGSMTGFSTFAPPDFVYGFLQANAIPNALMLPAGQSDPKVVTAARQRATVALLDWCGDKLSHFFDKTDSANLLLHWQYDGGPPVARIIEGTINPNFSPTMRHWTAGCFGTTAFLRAVMRTMNMGVQVYGTYASGHTIPHFMALDAYLGHGDDPYTSTADFSERVVGAGLAYPRAELLLDAATHDTWFTQAMPYDQSLANVGRRVNELVLKYLPLGLMVAAINDEWTKADHASGTVYDGLKLNYSLAQLEAMDLWGKIDAKIAAQGGQDVVMALHDLASLEKES